MKRNDVTSFFFYMWNAWSKEECEIAFKNSHCNWQHFWDKWNSIVNNKGVWGAAEQLYAELSDENRDLLVKRACRLYDGMRKRKFVTIRDLNVGEYFKFAPEGRVFVRGEYEHSSKKFSYYPFDDVNDEHFVKGERQVITDFEF